MNSRLTFLVSWHLKILYLEKTNIKWNANEIWFCTMWVKNIPQYVTDNVQNQLCNSRNVTEFCKRRQLFVYNKLYCIQHTLARSTKFNLKSTKYFPVIHLLLKQFFLANQWCVDINSINRLHFQILLKLFYYNTK